MGASLRAGVPLVLLPRSAEQGITADRLAAIGLARLPAAGPDVDWAAFARDALSDGGALAAARAFAADGARGTLQAALDRIVEAVEAATAGQA